MIRITSILIDYAQQLPGHLTMTHPTPVRWLPHVYVGLPRNLGGGHL